jgi:hypothetical protein
MPKITDAQYYRLVELLRNTYDSCAMTKAGLDHIFPNKNDPLPTEEQDVTRFIKRRTRLYRHSWQLTPLREALEILNAVDNQA